MEQKINIAELLKDCPKGMELYSPIFGEVYLDKIRPHLAIVVTKDKEQGNSKEEFLYDGRYGMNGECMLFPTKDQRDWSKFQRPFKDGDIVAFDSKEGTHLFIFNKYIRGKYAQCYMVLEYNGDIDFDGIGYYVDRLATEEEKQKLFRVIKDNGYKWNPETKTLEKLVEPKFKEGDIIYNRLQKRICIYYSYGDGVPHIKDCRYNESNTQFEKLDYPIPIAKQDYRLATEKEKEKLIHVIKENGYKWNAEAKRLERSSEPRFKVGNRVKSIVNNTQYDIKALTETHYTLVEVVNKFQYMEPIIEDKNWELAPNKFDITTLKPFAEVLVRDSDNHKWVISFFGNCNGGGTYKYSCMNGAGYAQCIPYKDNEHLLGKVDDCDEFYKTWE